MRETSSRVSKPFVFTTQWGVAWAERWVTGGPIGWLILGQDLIEPLVQFIQAADQILVASFEIEERVELIECRIHATETPPGTNRSGQLLKAIGIRTRRNQCIAVIGSLQGKQPVKIAKVFRCAERSCRRQ